MIKCSRSYTSMNIETGLRKKYALSNLLFILVLTIIIVHRLNAFAMIQSSYAPGNDIVITRKYILRSITQTTKLGPNVIAANST